MSRINVLTAGVAVLAAGLLTTVFATSVMDVKEKCAVCRKKSTYSELVSIYSSGRSPDLDTRGPDCDWTILSRGVFCCPECGYCARDVTSAFPGADTLILSKVYQAIRADKSLTDLARDYLCASYLREAERDFVGSGWMALKAAWDCDDNRGPSTRCRLEAYRLFQRSRSVHQHFGKDRLTEMLLLIDILRRTARFDEARLLCDTAATVMGSQNLKQILYYESCLIENRDVDRHTQREAIEKWWDTFVFRGLHFSIW